MPASRRLVGRVRRRGGCLRRARAAITSLLGSVVTVLVGSTGFVVGAAASASGAWGQDLIGQLSNENIRRLPLHNLSPDLLPLLRWTKGTIRERIDPSTWKRVAASAGERPEIWYAKLSHPLSGRGWEQIVPQGMRVLRDGVELVPQRELGATTPVGSWKVDDQGVYVTVGPRKDEAAPGGVYDVVYPSRIGRHVDLNFELADDEVVRFVRKYVTLPSAADFAAEFDTRRVLYAPAPSRFEFRMKVPDSPVLTFAIGLAGDAAGSGSDGAFFEILVEEEPGRIDQVYGELLDAKNWSGRWLDRKVDLSRFAGREVRLILQTFDDRGNLEFDYAAWAHPRLYSRGQPQTGPPNVLLVSIDTLRADHLSSYGYARNTSPNLDALASAGVLFERAYSHGSWTLPTHASLFTSLLPSRHGVTRGDQQIREDTLTLPQILASQGYETQAVVSVLLVSQAFGFQRGFDGLNLRENRPASEVTERALEWLTNRGPESFFLFLHYFDPHDPYWPPHAEDRERFKTASRTDGPLRGLDPASLRVSSLPTADLSRADLDYVVSLYDAEIRYVDRELGRVLQRLDSLGLGDRTVVVVTADHGEEFLEHRSLGHAHALYDELIHVPLIIRAPSVEGGRRVRSVVRHIDVLPTILDLVGGIAKPSGVQGGSLADLLAGPEERGRDDRIAISQNTRWSLRQASLVRGSNKLLMDFKGQREDWFDLARDPGERHPGSDPPSPETGQLRELLLTEVGYGPVRRYRLAWSGGGRKRDFTGSIRAEAGYFSDIERLDLEPDDRLELSPDAKLISFRATAISAEDGFSFSLHPPSAKPRWELRIDGAEQESVFLAGPDGRALAEPVKALAGEIGAKPNFDPSRDAGYFLWSEVHLAERPELRGGSKAVTLDQDQMEQLRALGYAE